MTCYSRTNRLSKAGVANKHPGVKGMPVLSEDEKVRTMKVLLALQGKTTKRHRDAHDAGKLLIKETPLRYGRVADPIEDNVGVLCIRTNASAADFYPTKNCSPEHLRAIHCPTCQSQRCTKDLKLQSRSQFSNLLCQKCEQVNKANMWACECGHRWRKCEVHEVRWCEPPAPRHARHKRKKPCDEKGGDWPLPKFRKETNACNEAHSFEVQARPEIRIALPPNSKLAGRFPHLVKRAVTDQRVTPG